MCCRYYAVVDVVAVLDDVVRRIDVISIVVCWINHLVDNHNVMLANFVIFVIGFLRCL